MRTRPFLRLNAITAALAALTLSSCAPDDSRPLAPSRPAVVTGPPGKPDWNWYLMHCTLEDKKDPLCPPH